MIFLIEYDRAKGQIVTFQTFDNSAAHEAERSRLDLELRLNQSDTKHEVVLLEALNEEALRRTHRRYFEDLLELAS
jgi:fido (protein-threonine AMPylation protein)